MHIMYISKQKIGSVLMVEKNLVPVHGVFSHTVELLHVKHLKD